MGSIKITEVIRFVKADSGITYVQPESHKEYCHHCDYSHNEDLKQYSGLDIEIRRQCPACNGRGKIKGTRLYKGKEQNIRKRCPQCNGHGVIDLPEVNVLGKCPKCNGTHIVTKTSSVCDTLTDADVQTMFELIDWNDSVVEERDETFNEGYLGIGLVGGCTDYGRYLDMTNEQFYEEVKNNFINGYHQYVHFVKKDKVPTAIKIQKHRSGWNLKPIYNS